MGDRIVPDLTDSPLDRPVEYDPETDTHRTQYVWSSPVALSTAVVEVVADVDDIDPREVDRLTEGVNPEALDALFAPNPTAESRRDGWVSFVLGDHRVTVRGTGEIEISPATSELG